MTTAFTVAVDTRWDPNSGIGRFGREVLQRAPNWVTRWVPVGTGKVRNPLGPWLLSSATSRTGAQAFFNPGFIPLSRSFPSVVSIHDLTPVENLGRAYRSYFQVIRPLYKKAAQIITVSNYSRGRIVEWLGIDPERISVAYNGISADFQVDGFRHSPGFPYLLYVGARRRYKNLRGLFAGYSASRASREVKLMLTGDPDQDTLDMATESGIADRIGFLGRLSDADLASCYRGAMGLLYLSTAEGFGLPPVEAMACGVPVVAANMGPIPEVVGTAALLVSPVDTLEIADGIDRAVFDSQVRHSLQQMGPRRAKLYNWERTADVVWRAIRGVGS